MQARGGCVGNNDPTSLLAAWRHEGLSERRDPFVQKTLLIVAGKVSNPSVGAPSSGAQLFKIIDGGNDKSDLQVTPLLQLCLQG